MTSSLVGVRVRRAAVASVATMALLGLSACGGDSGDSATDSSSSSAAKSSASSGSSSAGTSDTSNGSTPAAGSTVTTAYMTGLFDDAFAKATSAHVTLKSAGGSVPLTAEGDAKYGDSPSVQMTMDLASLGKTDMRLVDNTIYFKLPMLGGKYVKFDLDDPSNPLGSTFTDQLDPAALTKTLTGAITAATYVGNEDVDGEKLDHYDIKIDTKKMLANYGSALPSSAGDTAGMPASLDYNMWFDDKGLFRQVEADLGTSGTFTGTFSDWGEDVSVEAPPTSDVTELPGLPSSAASS